MPPRKQERLSKKKNIGNVLKERQYTRHTPLLFFVAVDNNRSFPRTVVVISKKFGSAVVRNRLRRRINSAFYRVKAKKQVFLDMVIYPKEPALKASMKELEESFLRGVEALL